MMREKILDLIRANANIRTVEIADRLDMEPESVRPHIEPDIRSGAIVEEQIRAPNGRNVLSFRFASAPPKPEVAAAQADQSLPARVVRALPPAARKTIAPSPAGQPALPQPADIEVPVTIREDGPLAAAASPSPAPQPARRRRDGPTRVDLAIECLRAAAGEPVPTEAVARAMGLPEKYHPASYLRDAMRDGRVVMRGRVWLLGPALLEPDPAPLKPAPHVGDCGCDDCETAMALAAALVESSPAVDAAPAAAMPETQAVTPPSSEPRRRFGGAENYPIPRLAPGAPDISIPGLYENGEFRKPAKELLGQAADTRTPAQRFLAGILSDGSLHLRIPGKEPRDLPPEQARVMWDVLRDLQADDMRALWDFMRAHGEVTWEATA